MPVYSDDTFLMRAGIVHLNLSKTLPEKYAYWYSYFKLKKINNKLICIDQAQDYPSFNILHSNILLLKTEPEHIAIEFVQSRF